ncbi:MAG: hypothetical protein KBF12_09270 [Sebaldella sp.]|nr:hypothetical protein [Sebaldella sp.]
MGLLKRMFWAKKISQAKFSLLSKDLILKKSDKKYYYFQEVYGKKYVKVLRIEDGEELILYEDWLD